MFFPQSGQMITSECESSNFCSPSASRLLRNAARLLKVSSRDMAEESGAGGVPERANAQDDQQRRAEEGNGRPQIELERSRAEHAERQRRADEQVCHGEPRQIDPPR